MSETTSGTTTDARSNRIGHEVTALQKAGYTCTLLRDADGVTYHLRIALERQTEEGPQPFSAILTLDAHFPQSPPRAVVLAKTRYRDAENQPYEVAITAPSPTLNTWREDTQLTDVVKDLDNVLQQERLLVADYDGVVPQSIDISSAPTSAKTSDTATTPQPLRSTRKLWPFFAIPLAIVIVSIAYLMYDPCSKDQDQVNSLVALGDLKSLQTATIQLSDMYQRGKTGQRGSCGKLFQNPAPLRDAYLAYGNLLSKNGEAVEAATAFQKIKEYQGADESAAALKSLTNQLWGDADQQATAGNYERSVQLLEKIQTINQNSLLPTNETISVTLRIAQVRLDWGDDLYRRTQFAEAIKQYEVAALAPSQVVVSKAKDHSQWAQRNLVLQKGITSTDTEWSNIIQQLNELGGSAQTDPFNKSYGQWRYDAYTGYGLMLINTAEHATDLAKQLPLAKQALVQVKRALADDLQPDDQIKAQDVQKRALTLLRNASPYQIAAPSVVSPEEFQQQSKDFLLSDPIKQRVNLLVLVPNPKSTPLIITDTNGQTIDPKDKSIGPNGIAATLPPGRWRIAVNEDEKEYNYVEVVIEGTALYEVIVTKHEK